MNEMMEDMAKLCKVPEGTVKIMTLLTTSLYITSIPLYIGFYHWSLISPNFFLAWAVDKYILSAFYTKWTENLANKYRTRHPILKECLFSRALPDSFAQDPKAQHDTLKAKANLFGRLPDNSAYDIGFELRRKRLANEIKYGISWDMADNSRAVGTIPITFAIFKSSMSKGLFNIW
eukprot:UN24183